MNKFAVVRLQATGNILSNKNNFKHIIIYYGLLVYSNELLCSIYRSSCDYMEHLSITMAL